MHASVHSLVHPGHVSQQPGAAEQQQRPTFAGQRPKPDATFNNQRGLATTQCQHHKSSNTKLPGLPARRAADALMDV